MDEVTHKKNFKPIIIRDLFMDKNPSMARWIPGFIYRLLSRMLRVDFMNDPILYHHGYKKDVDFAQLVKDHVYIIADESQMKFSYIQH